MPKSMLFWLIYLLCLFGYLWMSWPVSGQFVWGNFSSLPLFILLGLLGWAVFGKAVT